MKFTKLYIWGPNPFNNQLLASHIASITGMEPICIGTEPKVDSSAFTCETMLFCDCDKIDAEFYCQALHPPVGGQNAAAIVLINVERENDLQELVKRFGIRGVFFSTDPIEMIGQGIKMLLAGEYWLSRELLLRSLQSMREELRRDRGYSNSCMLTQREQEILKKIINGQDTQTIAEHLFISPNTVKTHISNIYRKIEATNRVQALLWASKNTNLLLHDPVRSQREAH